MSSGTYEAKIKEKQGTCQDNKGRQCGDFWVYDLDDLEDTAMDGVNVQTEYDETNRWKYNQDVDIILYNLIEKTDYGYIYCYAQDDEVDGVGNTPNKMQYNSGAEAGPSNVY